MAEEQEIQSSFSNDAVLDKLRIHQDLSFALIGGALAALVSAIIWAVITVSTKYQIGYMAIGVGLLVAFTVRYFGAGIDKVYGIIGAILAFIGCMLGNLFSQIGFIADAESLGYFEVFSYLNVETIIAIYKESFNPMDVLFYGLAIYEGYRFSFRNVTDEMIEEINSGAGNGEPQHSRYRLPLVFASLIIISGFVFKINKGVSGPKTYFYESGAKRSEGELLNSKEHGKWVYWDEQGNKTSEGFFIEGQPDSTWVWFDVVGNISKTGTYSKGLEQGVWIGYYTNGVVLDSGAYNAGRLEGYWVYRYENGNISSEGNYHRNLNDGEWKTYHENGNINTKGNMKEGERIGLHLFYYENGQIGQQVNYLDKDSIYILNTWRKDGTPLVVDGNGKHEIYSDAGIVIQQGEVKNGRQTGIWKTYFNNGNLQEEGEYKNGKFYVLNTWNINGNKEVINGEGIYYAYDDNGRHSLLSGYIKAGLRDGVWNSLYDTLGNKSDEITYKEGLLHGKQKTFYQSGLLYVEGNCINDLREGEWIWYYENGLKSSQAAFIKDKKHGKQIMWSETGQESKHEFYENGILKQEKLL